MTARVQVIEATKLPPTEASRAATHPERVRVAAYCRVSTDSDEQETSFESQVRHYTDYIREKPGWELAGIYADEGISGTSIKRRERFNAMLSDCEAGRIDMVVTKSISRWARNTVDSLTTIRRLRDLGIPVVFEKEGIDTMDPKGEVLITIMSSLAQQESDSISRNVRMGIQYQMQRGKGHLNTTRFLGYSKDERTGELRAVREEADLVRRIYREYLDGRSPRMIARRLTTAGIHTASGGPTWHASTIASMLRNEKYCGDLLMQKYYVTDFLTHRVARNTGEFPKYFVEMDHEPIVPKEVWQEVQDQTLRRSVLAHDPSRLRFGSARALEGRLTCGICGRTLKRCQMLDGTVEWQCRKGALKEAPGKSVPALKCPCRVVAESEAQHAALAAINVALGKEAELQRMRIELCADATKWTRTPGSSAEQTLGRAEAAYEDLQIRNFLQLIEVARERATDEGVTTTDMPMPTCADYEDFFYRTRYVPPAGVMSCDGTVATFDDELVSRHVQGITVRGDGYDVRLRCGLSIHVAT